MKSNQKAKVNEYVQTFEKVVDRENNLRLALKMRDKANTYSEYKRYSLVIDSLTGAEEWRKDDTDKAFDGKSVNKLVKKLEGLVEEENVNGLVHVLRTNLVRNIHSIHNPELYYRSFGTKYSIHALNRLFVQGLDIVLRTDKLKKHEKKKFFKETQLSYGRSALMLSGGAALGYYHPGIVKILFEHDLAPQVICGSSAGSIIAAMYALTKPEDRDRVFP